MVTLQDARAGNLAQYYIRRGMSRHLAESILLCRWAESLLSKSNDPGAGLNLRPVFDRPPEDLRREWQSIREEIFFDTLEGVPTNWPEYEGYEDGGRFVPWPIQDQEKLLFGRWSYLFQL